MSLKEDWDEVVDVVVVGFGGAGAAAAITAHDLGAQTLILEKMDDGGGNTALSGGGVISPVNIEDAMKYVKALSMGSTEDDVLRTLVEGAAYNMQWLQSLGADTEMHAGAVFKEISGAWAMTRCRVRGPGRPSDNLWRLLSENVRKRGIRIMTKTAAKELITSAGELVGVIASKDGVDARIKARRGMILCSGGFEFDESLKKSYLRCYPFYAVGSPGNTGDGVRMAQKVGAALWHMAGVSAPLGYKFVEESVAFPSSLVSWDFIAPPPSYGYVYVDQRGRRFVNEVGLEYHLMWDALDYFDPVRLDYSRIPSYAIFDEDLRIKGPVARTDVGYHRNKYRWSEDNSTEIQKNWIMRGQSIEDLAVNSGLPIQELELTISRYNSLCDGFRDHDFGRPRSTLVKIARPPFYSIKLWPTMLNTQGGPRRNAKAQVIDAFGKPIPRLYAAGELGSLWNLLYQGGGNLAECLVFGRIAGENAAGGARDGS